jgi:hypothetical protein
LPKWLTVVRISIAVTTLSLFGQARVGNGGVILDVRLSDSTKQEVFIPGEKFKLNVYAIVQGNNATDDETLYNLYAVFRSDTSLGASSDHFTGDMSTMTLAAPFNAGASQVGELVDADADGDVDLGGNATNSTYVLFRANPQAGAPVGARITFNGNPDSEEFFLGSFTFTLRRGEEKTEVNAIKPYTRIAPATSYVQDGVSLGASNYNVNSPGVSFIYIPEPTTLPVVGLCLGLLLRRRRMA